MTYLQNKTALVTGSSSGIGFEIVKYLSRFDMQIVITARREDKLLKLKMSMIDEVAKTVSTFMGDYRDMPEEERPKVLFVIDSLGMLLTPTCLLYTSPSPRDRYISRMPSSA